MKVAERLASNTVAPTQLGARENSLVSVIVANHILFLD